MLIGLWVITWLSSTKKDLIHEYITGLQECSRNSNRLVVHVHVNEWHFPLFSSILCIKNQHGLQIKVTIKVCKIWYQNEGNIVFFLFKCIWNLIKRTDTYQNVAKRNPYSGSVSRYLRWHKTTLIWIRRFSVKSPNKCLATEQKRVTDFQETNVTPLILDSTQLQQNTTYSLWLNGL